MTGLSVCYGSALGTVAVYSLSPIGIHAAGWKSVFYTAAAAVIMAVIVFAKMPLIDMHSNFGKATVICWAVICVAAGCICFAVSKKRLGFCEKAEPFNKH